VEVVAEVDKVLQLEGMEVQQELAEPALLLEPQVQLQPEVMVVMEDLH
jgi:hypothetical protein